MGELAEILRNQLRELAQSDARRLRKIEAALKASRSVDEPSRDKNKLEGSKVFNKNESLKALSKVDDAKALLSSGGFMAQNKTTLISLCKKNKIRRYSNLNKKGIASLLEENGIAPPPPKPYIKRTRNELAKLLEQLEKLLLN